LRGLHFHWVKWDTITTRSKNRGGLAICCTREANVSLFEKKIWSIINEPDKLWVRILVDKYLRTSPIMNIAYYVSHSLGSSYSWTTILNALDAIKPGFWVCIGKGDASLLYDNFLEEGPICGMVDLVHIADVINYVLVYCSRPTK